MKHIYHSHHSHSPYENHGNPKESTAAAQSTGTGTRARPSHDEVARKAYDIYLEEGAPQGRDMQHWLDAEVQLSV